MSRIVKAPKEVQLDSKYNKRPVQITRPMGPATRIWLAHQKLYRNMISTF
jgi:hypothetical protein